MDTFSNTKRIAIPKVDVGGAFFHHHDQIRASLCRRLHQHSPLSEVRDFRDKGTIRLFANPSLDGSSRTIRSSYYKVSMKNFVIPVGGAASGVIEIREV